MDIKNESPKAICTKTIVVTVIILSIIAGFLITNCTAVTNIKVDSNGFLVIDGKPQLIIGLYESSKPKIDAEIKLLADSGFNLLRTKFYRTSPDKVAKHLDLFHKYGLYGWMYLRDATELEQNDEDGKKELTEVITKYKDHPALLTWEIQDEILWNTWLKPNSWTFGAQQKELRELIEKAKGNSSEDKINQLNKMLEKANSYTHRGLWEKGEKLYDSLWAELGKEHPEPEMKLSKRDARTSSLIERLKRGCALVRQLDPHHPIWVNHAPRNSLRSLRQFNKIVDVVSLDIYPAPTYRTIAHSDMINQSLSSVGLYTRRLRASAPGKPAWMILHGFGWRDLKNAPCYGSQDLQWGRRPNLVELRLMVFDAILNGANGIIYYGTSFIERDSQLWKNVLKVSKELRALESVVLAKPSAKIPSVTTGNTHGSVDGPEIQLMLRKTGKDWVLIMINTS
ncbi:MAG: beta-galactosidase, partial [Planctomycetota bacterium]